ncbi:hypothetical protein AB6C94_10055 [Vibrio splendidus]
MLQICSGKLFQQEVEFRNNLRGVIYTNLNLGIDEKIETKAGCLLDTSTPARSNAIVYELEELMESTGNGVKAGVLVSHTIRPYILDFSAILSFAVNCTASPSYTLTDRLLSEEYGISTHTFPKKVVKRTFDTDVYLQEKDKEHLVKFTNHLIGLERHNYLGIMRAIRTYVTGMQRIADDFELAYTLLVASLESLAQDFDGYKSCWDDYDQRKKKQVDAALSGSDEEIAEKVRQAILDIEHISLGRRFRDFTQLHISPSFYREEANGITNPISKFDLPKALTNAYQARSQYVHQLRKLPDLLTAFGGGYSETCSIQNNTWLTIQGLSRLVRHVITEFVFKQPIVEKESYDYSRERAGIIQAPLAPQYWVANANVINGLGSKKLKGFLEQLDGCVRRLPNASITDIRPVLEKVEKHYNEFNKDDRVAYAALYMIFNSYVSPSEQMPNLEEFHPKLDKEFVVPSSHALIMNLLFNVPAKWDLSTHDDCLKNYFKTRNQKLNFRAPATFESGMLLQLAERYRLSENHDEAMNLISMAVENQPSNSELKQFEQDFSLDNQIPIEWTKVLLPKKDEDVEDK